MGADHPPGAVVPAGFLVGEVGQDDVPSGAAALPGQLADHREHHRVHPLHVDGAAPPQHPVAFVPGERRDGPVLGEGGDDVEVPVQDEGGPVPVPPRDPGEQVGPPRRGLEQLGLDPDLGEPGGDVLGGLPLPRAAAVAEVRRVDAQQVLAEAGDLILGARCRSGAGCGPGE
ncbi:MAG: hypothetical protein P8Z68_12400 [Kineosporiaceae bacterium]